MAIGEGGDDTAAGDATPGRRSSGAGGQSVGAGGVPGGVPGGATGGETGGATGGETVGADERAVDDEAVRTRLLDLRAAAAGRLAALDRSFDDVVAAAAGANSDDEHDPEGATIGFERAQVAALTGRARGTLGEVDTALARLAEGTYGRCAVCGRPIAPARLAARPTATTCVACAGRR
ncbi:TraR/DksA family transcriptional regulator [Georgenia sp. AZ-5]|uniref:TraR/DksA family transcriptional regulator n=1 Tax=Georgenia sp. AZ-5 TaxID=3367526 RepID=UPI003754FAE8